LDGKKIAVSGDCARFISVYSYLSGLPFPIVVATFSVLGMINDVKQERKNEGVPFRRRQVSCIKKWKAK